MEPYPMEVTTLADYFNVIAEIQRIWRRDLPGQLLLAPWFRGVTEKAEHKLVPGLYRQGRGAFGTDTRLRLEFGAKARAFTDSSGVAPIPDLHGWEIYFTMQHYRVPTRLLDWTESALVALYFALAKQRSLPTGAGSGESAVWMLDAGAMNQRLHPKETPKGGVVPPTAKFGLKYLPRPNLEAERSLPELPLAIQPMYSNRRIAAQRGAFTVHGSERRPLEELEAASDTLRRIDIRAGAAAALSAELITTGMGPTSVFPDLEGLAEEIAPLAFHPDSGGLTD